MPQKRESDDYAHHIPNTGGTGGVSTQFTWQEGLWLTIVMISYLLGYAIEISVVAEKYSLEEPPKNRGLYLVFLLLPHFAAGLKNLQYHYREAREEEGEDSRVGWILSFVFLPFSPLIRFGRAWKFGLAEKKNWENGIRFVDELVTAGVLRLFDVFLGDAPILALLVRDDVWNRSADWKLYKFGPEDTLLCGARCLREEPPESPLEFWTIFRMIFLLSKMAQAVTFYLVGVKRLQRLQHPDHYSHLRGPNSRKGRLNIFATLLLYFAHFFFIGSRVMGYSMVSTTWGSWVYLIIGGHWLLNTAWHLITTLNTKGLNAARSVSSFTMGGVWLFALTNEQGGRQLGRFVLYYCLAFAETAVCGFLWNSAMKGSGDYFAYKASWTLLILFVTGILIHLVYYSLCHPGTPAPTRRGLLCCSGNRRDPPVDTHHQEYGGSSPI